ncbi:MAG: winged helix-turn-helix domain-containing protein [Blastocatellia bacterium]
MSLQTNHIYEFGPFRLDPRERLLARAGMTISLTPKAFDLLLALVERHGHLVEKEELFQAVWPDSFVEESNLSSYIALIRRTLGDGENGLKFIETVPKRGYRFVAEVREAWPTSDNDLIQEKVESRTEATPPDVVSSPPGRASLRKWPVVFLAASVIAGVAGWAGWRGAFRPSHALPQGAVPAPLRTIQVTSLAGLDAFPSLSPDGNTVAFTSGRSGTFEIYVSQLTPGSREMQITSDGGQNIAPAWSPDGKLIAYCSRERGGIWVIPALGGVAKQLSQSGSRPSWSPDGSSIAFQSAVISSLDANSRAMSPSVIQVVSLQSGETKPLTKEGVPPGGHGSPVWSPDGTRLAFTVGDYFSADLAIWSMSANGSDFKRLVMGAFDPLYAPDGERIYFARDFGLWSLTIARASGEPTGEPVQIIPPTGSGRIRFLSISADGKKLAFNPLTSKSNLWSLPLSARSGQPVGPAVPLTQNTNFRTNLPSFSPDGRRIAYLSWLPGGYHTGAYNIWVMDADGKNQTQLTTNGAAVPSWLGKDRVAFLLRREEGARMAALPLNGGNEQRLFDFSDKVEYARVSPDGKTVAFHFAKNGVNIWTTGIEGGEARQLTFDSELMAFPCWSPDGRFLAFQVKRGENQHIAMIPSAGGAPTQLTFDKGVSQTHSWAPDGDKIAFAGLRNGYWNLWWVSRTTKQTKQLTNYTKLNAFVRYPAWSPLGDQMVYEYAETTGNIWVMNLK